MQTLDSRTIVITGGSMGIGLAVARKCAAEGATVVLAARNLEPLGAALAELRSVSQAEHAIRTLDVAQPAAVAAFADWCAERFGQVHGLVNCAGVYGPIGKTPRIDMAAFRHAIEINLMGTVYMCHALAALIVGLPRKKIVNFAGGGAATLFPYYSAYAASKAAIVRFTENLAVELTDEGFDVNCVAPGFVLTRLHQQTLAAGPEAASAAFYENTKRQIESGGVPVEKAADLTAFLLSSASDGITGKFISAPYDSWHTPELQNRLRQAKDLATLRRIDERFFSNVETR